MLKTIDIAYPNSYKLYRIFKKRNKIMIFTPENILNLLTLTGLEIILGIDNIIFIAILVQNLPSQKRSKARYIGLSLALLMRIGMLFGASWIMKLQEPLFTIINIIFTGKTILLLVGGIFLIVKAILEIIEMFDVKKVTDNLSTEIKDQGYLKIIIQIIFIDLVLSFDSVITAVGMSNDLSIIIIAMLIAIITMIACSGYVSKFIYNYPSVKVIALCFIALVGIMLFSQGLSYDFPKIYIYIPIIFSSIVEIINILIAKKHNQVR